MPKLLFKINFIRLYFFILLMAVLFCPAQNAQAVETGNLGLIPAHPDPAKPITASWFVYEAKPGTVVEDTAMIKNHNTESPVTVRMYAVDGTTTTNGVFALSQATDPQSGIGKWTEILEPTITEPITKEVSANQELTNTPEQEQPKINFKKLEGMPGLEIEVPAGNYVEVPFKITVPENAAVGDHTGGLIIEAAPKMAEGTGFNVVTRIGARIYLTVPGEKIFSLKIDDFSWSRQDYTIEELERLFLGKIQRFLGLYRKGVFTVKLENMGNVQLGTADAPLVGKLVIRNIVNQIVDENEVDLGTILPKGEITQNLTWKRNNPLFLRYQANLEVTYAKDKAPELAVIYFWVIPWLLFLFIGGLIILIIMILLIIKLIRVRKRSKMIRYVVQQGDTPEKIAEHFKVSLKKLVKINKIKAEKPIQPGQTLAIPPSDLVPDPAAFRLAKFNKLIWIANSVLFIALVVLVVLIVMQLMKK